MNENVRRHKIEILEMQWKLAYCFRVHLGQMLRLILVQLTFYNLQFGFDFINIHKKIS